MKEETTSSDEEILIVEVSHKNKLEINSVSQSPPKNKIFASMFIKGKQISFQLDSGATCNLLPQHLVPPGTMVANLITLCACTVKHYYLYEAAVELR